MSYLRNRAATISVCANLIDEPQVSPELDYRVPYLGMMTSDRPVPQKMISGLPSVRPIYSRLPVHHGYTSIK